MNPTESLKSQLFRMTKVEKLQNHFGGNVNYMDLDYINDPIPRMPQWDFFEDGDIDVTKNNRFSYVPAHTHSFIEFNYMYSGSSIQYINDTKTVLHEKELLVMDKDVVQRIDYTNKNDILINIIIKTDSPYEDVFESVPQSTNEITQLIYNGTRVNSLHNNFMLFDLKDAETPRSLMNALIATGMNHSAHRQESLRFIFSALILELPNLITHKSINFADSSSDDLLPVLKYIESNFATTTLSDVSSVFRYNTNYLGNKIKTNTGKTFNELIERRRLSAAQNLMLKTNLNLTEISETIGYQNSSSLFRLFKKYLKTTPSEYKRRVHPKVPKYISNQINSKKLKNP
ncbi:AraC family transcriptional regulator [Lentilactobacillus kefiri]|nr:AraC family transcriptional regulator [Lentilactobacillus kefiri]MCJ2161069.1 AraC family transcriptional regulator [Lentilactobacillus kefiri]MDH5109413.1 AraC family transcriptional regulator [Lentilactobacillus kefiri]MDM7493574.1 AraC family transcriptional regulator [Lentilactobacillus kefiri]PAK58565.1 AraC family transcriptional regulator [Lentilactobacillus kefiri]PAK83867.1 AraC family transcriptional regulator [Lentilactobacillus kefiri]